MSYYNDASLVLLAQDLGKKAGSVAAQKPMDANGQMTFTRTGDTATRVNSAGLIEKVRTNLLTYSNTFSNAAWSKNNLTLTSGQTDPNGGSTAFLVQSTGTSAPTFGQVYSADARTTSIFAKAGTRSNFSILNGGYNNGAQFNLSTQTATAFGVGSLAKIESVGSGWFRCSVFLSSSTESQFILTDIAGNGGVIGDNLTFAFAQAETGDIATDYIPTTTAAVSVGPVANVPRLDYLNSSCPRLLLEPQRTNLLQYSEQFNNAYWEKGSVATITANSVISPDGTQNADTLTANGTGQLYVRYNVYLGTAQTCSSSIFAKKANHRYVGLRNSGTVSAHDVFDFDTKTWTNNSGATLSYDELGNGWFRLKSTNTDAVNLNYYWSVIPAVNTSGSENTTASNLSVYIWGAQAEQNAAYATSYIPTLGAAVTRGADACYKNSLSVFGTNVGSFFVDAEGPFYNGVAAYLFDLSDNSSSAVNRIGVYVVSGNEFILYTNVGTSFTVSATSRKKIAVVWSGANIKLYLNGAKVVDITYANANPTSINLNSRFTEAEYGNSKFNQVLTFPTALSDSQCIELTTI